MYSAKYEATLVIVALSTFLPSKRIDSTERVWSICFKLERTDLNNSITRDSLSPPAVEPAHAPVNISKNKIPFENVGHRLKSAVA